MFGPLALIGIGLIGSSISHASGASVCAFDRTGARRRRLTRGKAIELWPRGRQRSRTAEAVEGTIL